MDSKSKSEPSDPYKLIIRYLDEVDDPTLAAHVRRTSLRSALATQGIRNGIIPASILSLLPIPKLNQLMALLSDQSTDETSSFSVSRLKKHLELDGIAYDDSEEVRRKRARLGETGFDRVEFVWLKNLTGYREMQYRPMQLANRLFEKRLDRDDALVYCYSHFNDVLNAIDACRKQGAVYPVRTPMIAMAAAPGGGKSFFLDELGELRDADISNFCANKSLQDDLKSALVLKVSYTGDCSVSSPNDSGSVGLGARIIWGYFRSILHDGIREFKDFFPYFYRNSGGKSTSFRECIQVTAHHFLKFNLKQRAAPPTFSVADFQSAGGLMVTMTEQTERPLLVMLLVDNLSETGVENATEMSTYIGNMLDSSGECYLDDFSKFVLLPVFTCTTSDMRLLHNPRPGNGRTIMSVPVSVPLTSAPAAMKAKLNMGSEFDQLIDVLCNDVGYHGRMLEAIVELLEDVNGHPPEAMNADSNAKVVNLRQLVKAHTCNPLLSLSICRSELVTHAKTSTFFAPLIRDDLMNAVCISLLGFPVSSCNKIEASYGSSLGPSKEVLNPTSFRDLQDLGVFIGDDFDAMFHYGHMYPVMSPLQLLEWATLKKSSTKQNGNALLFDSIIQVFTAFCKDGTWQTFESFHHNVEVMRRMAKQQLGLLVNNDDEMKPKRRFIKLVTDNNGVAKSSSAQTATNLNLEMDLDSTTASGTVQLEPVENSKFTTAIQAAALSAVVASGSSVKLASKQYEQILYDIRIYQKLAGIREMCAHTFLNRCSWREVLQFLKKAEDLTCSESNTTCTVYLAAAYESLFEERRPESQSNLNKHSNSPHAILLNHALLESFYGPSIKGVFALVLANA